MSKHISGPWTYEPTAGAYKVTMGDSIRSFVVPGYGMNHSQANAKRIVDCVNAMEGIPDPSNLRATWDAIAHLELDKYKNLKEAVQSLIQGIDNGMHMKPDSIIVEALRQAIK